MPVRDFMVRAVLGVAVPAALMAPLGVAYATSLGDLLVTVTGAEIEPDVSGGNVSLYALKAKTIEGGVLTREVVIIASGEEYNRFNPTDAARISVNEVDSFTANLDSCLAYSFPADFGSSTCTVRTTDGSVSVRVSVADDDTGSADELPRLEGELTVVDALRSTDVTVDRDDLVSVRDSLRAAATQARL